MNRFIIQPYLDGAIDYLSSEWRCPYSDWFWKYNWAMGFVEMSLECWVMNKLSN